MAAPKITAAEWLDTTIGLLPRGDFVWTRDPTTNLNKILAVLASERGEVYDRATQLLDTESFPTEAVELLPEWERALGLPDPCRAAPGSLAERWAEVADVFFGDHEPTPENMVAWAERAGWNIEIREQRDFVAGVSMACDAVGENDFTWIVTVLDQVRTYFHAGDSTSGDALWNWPDITTLECVLRRANPGHLKLNIVVPP